jgi:O-antigen ligase
MALRPQLTAKQKLLCLLVLACLQSPLVCFVIYLAENPGEFSTQFIASAFALNMVIGVSLFAFITEQWIRKIE